MRDLPSRSGGFANVLGNVLGIVSKSIVRRVPTDVNARFRITR
jgi:hypothetical protein